MQLDFIAYLIGFPKNLYIHPYKRKNHENIPDHFCYDALRKEGRLMENKTIVNMETVIDYIEAHLDDRLDLDQVAQAVHYSKYHLHRLFTATAGMTLHDYVQRRQLTEAAKLLVFSGRPILDIALTCGYESQQAFSSAFKAMYKMPPAEFRRRQVYYPLQLRFTLHQHTPSRSFTADDIRLAQSKDIPAMMNLMRLVIDGYPVMVESDYLQAITSSINENRALVLIDGGQLIGAMTFLRNPSCIDFWGIHPQYRHLGIQKLFLDALIHTYLPGQEISMTTFRAGDRADTGYRALLTQLGFAERELLTEFGYPTQRFTYSPKEVTKP